MEKFTENTKYFIHHCWILVGSTRLFLSGFFQFAPEHFRRVNYNHIGTSSSPPFPTRPLYSPQKHHHRFLADHDTKTLFHYRPSTSSGKKHLQKRLRNFSNFPVSKCLVGTSLFNNDLTSNEHLTVLGHTSSSFLADTSRDSRNQPIFSKLSTNIYEQLNLVIALTGHQFS